MIGGPDILEEVAGWVFMRWSYEGAPLEAHRVSQHRYDSGGYSVEIDGAGDLVFDGLPYEGANPLVPGWVLRRLVDDAFARGAPDWTETPRG